MQSETDTPAASLAEAGGEQQALMAVLTRIDAMLTTVECVEQQMGAVQARMGTVEQKPVCGEAATRAQRRESNA